MLVVQERDCMLFLGYDHFILMQLSRLRYYEKPTKERERREYEKCLRIYNKEMKKKVEFVMKQHAPLPPI